MYPSEITILIIHPSQSIAHIVKVQKVHITPLSGAHIQSATTLHIERDHGAVTLPAQMATAEFCFAMRAGKSSDLSFVHFDVRYMIGTTIIRADVDPSLLAMRVQGELDGRQIIYGVIRVHERMLTFRTPDFKGYVFSHFKSSFGSEIEAVLQ
jgi:hypothetical protein